MFGKLFGSFKSIGDKLRTGWNIGKKIFSVGKELFNRFFNKPPEYRPSENENRLKNTYSLEQRIIADKTPDIDDDVLKARFDKLRDSGFTKPNESGFQLRPVPSPPKNKIIEDPFDIDFSSFT
jgi:hypothetical protein